MDILGGRYSLFPLLLAGDTLLKVMMRTYRWTPPVLIAIFLSEALRIERSGRSENISLISEKDRALFIQKRSRYGPMNTDYFKVYLAVAILQAEIL
jgi:hypothetical protein